MFNEGTPFLGDPFVFPSYRDVGPHYIATLSLLSLTIGLSVWMFSISVVPNAASASFARTSSQEHQHHVDHLPYSPSSIARPSSVSYSSSSEISEDSNTMDKKKKKRKIKKKKTKQGSNLATTARHVRNQQVTDNRVGSVDVVKIT
jgi:hypothetical protein